MRALVLLAGVVLLGCQARPPGGGAAATASTAASGDGGPRAAGAPVPGAVGSRDGGASAVALDGGARAAAAGDGGARAAESPRLVEVELRGVVKRGAAPARGRAVVMAMDAPCFEPGGHYLGTTTTTVGGRYFIEVFPPWNTKVWVCAALLVGPSRTTPWRASFWAPLLAVGQGEVEFNDTHLELKKGPPVTLPAGLKLD